MIAWLSLAVLTAGPVWVGEPVTAPRRIVSLAPSLTEIVFALGRGDRIVGVTRYDDFPAEVRTLPKVGGLVDPDPEAVLSLRPDVVLGAQVRGGTARIEALQRFGPPVLLLPTETLSELWDTIGVLGLLLAAERQAEALVQRLRTDLTRLEERSRGRPPMRLLVVVGFRPLVAAGPDSFLGKLLPVINAENILMTGGAFPQIDLEVVARKRPDIIVEATMSEPAPGAFWDKLATVNGTKPRVVVVHDDRLLRPGPRLVEGLEALEKTLRAKP